MGKKTERIKFLEQQVETLKAQIAVLIDQPNSSVAIGLRKAHKLKGTIDASMLNGNAVTFPQCVGLKGLTGSTVYLTDNDRARRFFDGLFDANPLRSGNDTIGTP